MGRYLITVILACLVLCPLSVPVVKGETMQEVPRLFGIFAPKPGAWSEYAIFDKATGKRTVMRISIVSVEDDSYWYEMVNREGTGSNIIRMLVNGDPDDPENILRLIMKSGVNPAQEMGPDFLPMGRRMASQMFEQRSGIPTGPKVNLQNIKTGEGVATVPAGSFDVELHRLVDTAGRVYAEYKFSREVRPFGVVASDTENRTMVLVGHGTGAKSLITEKPTMMIQPPEMEERMPGGMAPGMDRPQGIGPGPETGIRKIPGMGRGYEPRQ